FDSFQPDVLLDLNPLPGEFYQHAREQGTQSVYWLLEDGYADEYRQWEDVQEDCDLFVAYQGSPFTPKEAPYVPWGADPMLRSLREVHHQEIVLHGSFSPNRAEAGKMVCEEFTGDIPISIVGPNWSEWDYFDELNERNNVTVEDRWTEPPETARLLRGRIVVAPWRTNRHNAVLPRYWFSMGAGGCLVCDRVGDLERHVKHNKDCVMFDGAGDMIEQLHSLINDPQRVQSIQQHGRSTILSNHTLPHRIYKILSLLDITPPDVPEYIDRSD
ncbi:MAG: glycosyltransferase, partial [bacterium]